MTQPTQTQIEAATEAIRLNWMTRGIGPAALAKAALDAAAEVGRDDDVVIEGTREGFRLVEAATIERCARVVNEWKPFVKDRAGLIAAIRARKET